MYYGKVVGLTPTLLRTYYQRNIKGPICWSYVDIQCQKYKFYIWIKAKKSCEHPKGFWYHDIDDDCIVIDLKQFICHLMPSIDSIHS